MRGKCCRSAVPCAAYSAAERGSYGCGMVRRQTRKRLRSMRIAGVAPRLRSDYADVIEQIPNKAAKTNVRVCFELLSLG